MRYSHEFHIYSLIRVDPEIKQYYDRVKSSLENLAAKNMEIILTYKDGTRKVNAGKAFYFYYLEDKYNEFVSIVSSIRKIDVIDQLPIYGNALLMSVYSLKLDRLLTIKYWGKKLREGYSNAKGETLMYDNNLLLNVSGVADYENKVEPQIMNTHVKDIKEIHELIKKYWFNSLYLPSNLKTFGTLFLPQSNTFVISKDNLLEFREIFATVVVSVPDDHNIEILSFDKEKSKFKTETLEMENASRFKNEVPNPILLVRKILIDGNKRKKEVSFSVLSLRKAKNLAVDFSKDLLNLILRTIYVYRPFASNDPIHVTDIHTLDNVYDKVVKTIDIKETSASKFLNVAPPAESLYKLDDEKNVIYVHPVLRFPFSIFTSQTLVNSKEYNEHLRNFVEKSSRRMEILDKLNGGGNPSDVLLPNGNFNKSWLLLLNCIKNLVVWRNLVKEVSSRIESSSVIR